MRWRLPMAGILAASVVMAGCQNRWRREPPRPCPPPMAIPPAQIPEGPPPAPIPGKIAPPPPQRGAELLLPEEPPKSKSDYSQPGSSDRSGAILETPDRPEPKAVDSSQPPPRPSAKLDQPRGIAEFTFVKEGVAAGQRPALEGLDWLQSAGYATIVHIKRPDDDDASDQRQIERRGMKYVALVLTPDTLSQRWLDDFSRIVDDKSKQPVFVYGEPATVGAVWYLYLRIVEFLTHDEARIRAGRLGLKDEGSEMYRAALKVIENR